MTVTDFDGLLGCAAFPLDTVRHLFFFFRNLPGRQIQHRDHGATQELAQTHSQSSLWASCSDHLHNSDEMISIVIN